MDSNINRKALIVEDEPLVASLIASALSQAQFESRQAESVAAALVALKTFDPDLVLLDINLGEGPSGIDLAHHLRRESPDVSILILTKSPDVRSSPAGTSEVPAGCGFLRKESVGDLRYLLDCIEKVMQDDKTPVRQDLDPMRPLAELTNKQVDLLRLLALGYTNQELAERLGVAAKTIEQRLTLVFKVLGVDQLEGINPRAEAIRIFVQTAGLPTRG